MKEKTTTRRAFVKKTALLTTAALGGTNLIQARPSMAEPTMYQIGPREGYSLRIGTLLSTMTMMRHWVVGQVQNLSVEELDFVLDDHANSIGAMLLHLAATEKYYQLNTFDEMEWGTWEQSIKAEWDVPMSLGDNAREEIKGNPIEFYLEKLAGVRKITEAEFAKRDDSWLEKSEPFFEGKATNNHCKWFHVCEHESNHLGQIKFIKKRIS